MRFEIRKCLLLVLLLLLAESTSGQTVTTSDLPSTDVLNINTRATLDKSISVDYEDLVLARVIEDIQLQSGLNITLHDSTGDEGFGLDSSVATFKAEQIRISTLLELICAESDCTYRIHDGVVELLSEDAALDHLSIVVFDCRKLFGEMKPKRILVADRLFDSWGGGTGMSAERKFEVVDRKKEGDATATPKTKITLSPNYKLTRVYEVSPESQLRDTLQETVDPDSWESNGGVGRMQLFNGILIVSQTEVNIRKINALVDKLNQLIVKQE